jgi:diguanylate cyclase (GGDEF)-like protein
MTTTENPVLDRVALDERLDTELAFALRHGTPLGVLLVYPEDVRPGDACRLDELTARLRTLVRAGDVVARFDDRTLAVVVAGVLPPAMRQLAERLCSFLAQRRRRTDHDPRFLVSIGMALAEPLRDDESAETLLRRACVALEQARAAGGSRVKA